MSAFKAIEFIPVYDGFNKEFSMWKELVLESLKLVKEKLSDILLIQMVKTRLGGEAKTFANSLSFNDVKSLESLLKKLEDEFTSPTAIAKQVKYVQQFKQNSMPPLEYFDKKLEMLEGVKITEEAKLVEMIDGLDSNLRLYVSLCNNLSEVRKVLKDATHLKKEESIHLISKKDATCFRCKKKGHFKKDCKVNACSFCGKFNHKEENCFKKEKKSFNTQLVEEDNKVKIHYICSFKFPKGALKKYNMQVLATTFL